MAKEKPSDYISKKYERPGLTADEIDEIKEAFKLFDEKKIGRIRIVEMKEAMISLGFDSRHKRLFGKVTESAEKITDGFIEFEDFMDLVGANMVDDLTREDIKRVFDVFDIDKNGKITEKELKRVTKELGENLTDAEISEMMERADTERAGFLTPDAFYSIVTKRT